MNKSLVIYSLLLALLAFVLKTIEYQWLLKELSWPFYLLLVAIVFVVIGLWLGQQIFTNKAKQAPFIRNQRAIDSIGLSERELEVLAQVLKGHSNQVIAEQLFISVNTVKTHLKSAYGKLGVSNRILAIEKLRALHIFQS